MEDGDGDYNREYYQANAEKLKARQRERYANDPDYRTWQIERAKARYASGREVRGAIRLGVSALRDRNLALFGSDPSRRRTCNRDGEVLHSVGFLADALGKCQQTVVSWQRRDILPPPTWVDGTGRRWYSEDYIERAARAVKTGRAKNWTLGPLREHVAEAFAGLWEITKRGRWRHCRG